MKASKVILSAVVSNVLASSVTSERTVADSTLNTDTSAGTINKRKVRTKRRYKPLNSMPISQEDSNLTKLAQFNSSRVVSGPFTPDETAPSAVPSKKDCNSVNGGKSSSIKHSKQSKSGSGSGSNNSGSNSDEESGQIFGDCGDGRIVSADLKNGVRNSLVLGGFAAVTFYLRKYFNSFSNILY